MIEFEFTLLLHEPTGALSRLLVRRTADNLAEAVVSAVEDLEEQGFRPVRLVTDDWVTLADIARRVGRSRENVRLWSIGRYGPGGFPPPVNPGLNTAFYSWVEVGPWLRDRKGCEVPDDQPTLVALDLALRLRRLAARLDESSEGAVRRLQRATDSVESEEITPREPPRPGLRAA